MSRRSVTPTRMHATVAGGRIVQRSQSDEKSPVLQARQRQAVEGSAELLPVAVALPVRHEEHLVGPDRTAKRVAVLVPLERGSAERPVRPRTMGRGSNASLRWNSNTVPWNWFVPDLVTTFTWLAARPNSAE